jgi:hypothetical protein
VIAFSDLDEPLESFIASKGHISRVEYYHSDSLNFDCYLRRHSDFKSSNFLSCYSSLMIHSLLFSQLVPYFLRLSKAIEAFQVTQVGRALALYSHFNDTRKALITMRDCCCPSQAC